MDGTITLSKAALVKLLDWTILPNPDDPDSPIGPFTRDLSWVLLNPQPLPPVAGPFPEPWRRMLQVMLNPQPLPPVAGPHPQPWRSAFLSRMVIDQAVAQYRSAEIMSGSGESEKALEGVRVSIREFVDDYCGTGAPRWPLPWPFPLASKPIRVEPLDLLVAGAQFQKAADVAPDGPLQADFAAAADQLFETAVRQLESGSAEAHQSA